MKSFGTLLLLTMANIAAAQCSFTALLQNSGTQCLGSASFHVSAPGNITKIVWRNGNEIVRTVVPQPADNFGVTVAGGNGPGLTDNHASLARATVLHTDGYLYIAELVYRVQKWMPGAASGVTIAGGNGRGNADNQCEPYDIYVADNNDIFVLDNFNSRVQKWVAGASQGITVAGGNGAGDAANQFNFPSGMCMDAAGNIYVADYVNHRIQQWAPGASVGITVAGGNGPGPAANQLNYPSDVAIYDGSLYISDQSNYRVQKWILGASNGTTIAGGNGRGSAPDQFFGINGISVDKDGIIYVADASNMRIQKITPGSGSMITVAGGNGVGDAANQLTYPTDVFPDNNGNIFIADYNNSRIQKWRVSPGIDFDYIPAAAGVYTAEVTNGSGCTVITNAITVLPNTASALTITPSGMTACSDAPVSFTVPIAANVADPVYRWTVNGVPSGPDSPTFRTDNLADGDTVACTITSSCTTASGFIILKTAPCPVYIPTAFSPNNNRKNDVFYILGGNRSTTIKNFSVFNRWGQRVFHIDNGYPNDPRFGWDGKFHGVEAVTGMYIYVITLLLSNGTAENHKGTLLLTR